MEERGYMEIDENYAVLKKVINSVPGHLYWKDVNGVYLGCNKQQAEALCLESPNDIIGKTDHDLAWSANADFLQKIDKEVVSTLKEVTREEKVSLPGYEKERVFYSQKMPFFDEAGVIRGVIGISQDITELKEAQSKTEQALLLAEEAERRRKQFLENQEHDINTALAGIQYASVELEDIDDLSEVRDIAGRITKCAERLQDYHGSLLQDLAWLDDKGKIIEHRTEVREALAQLYDINVLSAQIKGLKLTFGEVDETIPNFLILDELVLVQCLQNVLINAIKFTQEGTITLSVKRMIGHDEQAILVFSIKDTGRGIADEDKRYIFEDYYKSVPSNQPDLITGQLADEDKGRGLGLALALKKAQAMGGELHLEWSEVGVGSEFVLSLPLNPSLNQSN